MTDHFYFIKFQLQISQNGQKHAHTHTPAHTTQHMHIEERERHTDGPRQRMITFCSFPLSIRLYCVTTFVSPSMTSVGGGTEPARSFEHLPKSQYSFRCIYVMPAASTWSAQLGLSLNIQAPSNVRDLHDLSAKSYVSMSFSGITAKLISTTAAMTSSVVSFRLLSIVCCSLLTVLSLEVDPSGYVLYCPCMGEVTQDARDVCHVHQTVMFACRPLWQPS